MSHSQWFERGRQKLSLKKFHFERVAKWKVWWAKRLHQYNILSRTFSVLQAFLLESKAGPDFVNKVVWSGILSLFWVDMSHSQWFERGRQKLSLKKFHFERVAKWKVWWAKHLHHYNILSRTFSVLQAFLLVSKAGPGLRYP